MPAAIRLLRYDVFTARPGGGNPLGVVLNPPPLDTVAMQRVATRLGLSETVFVRPRRAGEWDVRIFTPVEELPFAGHPTLGAAVALADRGLAGQQVVFHEPVGRVEVEVSGRAATLTTPGPPEPVAVADPGDVLAALGLPFADLHPELGVRGWSAGVPFTMLAVRDPLRLASVEVDRRAWEDALAASDAPDLYVLAPVEGTTGGRWRARMFAPSLGIPEDPATGAAAAASVGFVAGVVGERRLERGWVVEQGVEMGRPSEIRVQPVRRAGELVAVRVGGQAVPVGEEDLAVPDS